ncbi:MAG TPA: trehalose-6-phosphate synthase [Streptosporangiaceae bacterium]|nr:trehalose-6-phosphate synthase [Streptosporangiaceae bacterium]
MNAPTDDPPQPPVVAVANRLPVQGGADGWELSPGGLVTALRPVMTTHTGAWVGWDGGTKGMPSTLPDLDVRVRPISLSAAQVRHYYHGFANATLWPLLHNAIEKPRFDRAWWQAYQQVNAAFADATIAALDDLPGALAWVHDYQLMLVPQLIRKRRPGQPVGFFLHVPWPSPDIFARCPWREEILRGLLGADVVSFHTEDYRKNFVRACDRLLSGGGIKAHGPTIALPDGRTVLTTAAPISIDAAEFRQHATDQATDREVEALREQFAGRTLLLGVDRLDYTKGIIERLLAFEMLLERREDLRTTLAFLQIAVPSRDDVREYRDLRAALERHIGRINGRFTEPGHDVPVHYLYRGLSRQQIAAYYAVTAALLATPLIDGMNLVAKEYVTVQAERGGDGALVLSEFTGAAVELRQAVLCNPFDIEGLSHRIEHALQLPAGSRHAALAAMARRVRTHDVHRWVADQLAVISPGGRREAVLSGSRLAR